MRYRLIQYRDSQLNEFNKEVNDLLEDGWKLEGDYRITKVKEKDKTSYLVISQVMTKEVEKKTVGFNVHLLEEEAGKIGKKIKKK